MPPLNDSNNYRTHVYFVIDLSTCVLLLDPACFKSASKCIVHLVYTGGSVLCVAHKGSVEICTRMLRGLPPRNRKSFRPLMERVPYCGVACLEETKNAMWKLVKPAAGTFTHDNNNQKTYSWDIWL